MKQPFDTLTIKRVANGWIISQSMRNGPEMRSLDEPPQLSSIAATVEDIKTHVEAWAEAQTTTLIPR